MSAANLREILDAERLNADIWFDEPMSRHTYLGIGGPAEAFVSPRDRDALAGVLRVAREHGVQAMPVGGGTNLLVSDRGIAGIVVFMGGFNEIRLVGENGEVDLEVEAGVQLVRLVKFTVDYGLTGMEGLSGIPGHVGGAIAGNAGAFGCEIKDVVQSVTVMDGDGALRSLSRQEADFSYRRAGLPPGAIVLEARLRLGRDEPAEVARRYREFIEMKKSTQPLGERSAGCVYRNPPAGEPAGKLIEEAGCKGMSEGDIEVSQVHANFFVNRGKGTAEDYMRLMLRVASAVRAKSGVVLEPEIRMVGRC